MIEAAERVGIDARALRRHRVELRDRLRHQIGFGGNEVEDIVGAVGVRYLTQQPVQDIAFRHNQERDLVKLLQQGIARRTVDRLRG